MMAAATAEATGTLGVAITTQGPGAASAVNGVAHAKLDRCPLLLISDGWTAHQAAFDTHQVFDQQGLMSPLVKSISRLEGPDPAGELEALIATANAPPWGPIYLELTGEAARLRVEDREEIPPVAQPADLDRSEIEKARTLIAAAKRPVLLVGLEARRPGSGARLEALAARLGCPVLSTYKGRGAVSDVHPNVVGSFTGGAAERECVGSSDLIVLCGFDPVELIGRPWLYDAKVLDLGPIRHPVHYVQPAAHVTGDLPAVLDALAACEGGGGWSAEEIARLRQAMVERLAYQGNGDGLTPEQVVRAAHAAAAGLDARITVDAGAHMFSAMAFWPVQRPGDVLISNGLASMAFAVPAGIAMSLETPERPVIAFTGDGGLMMGAGELSTAAHHAGRLCIIVFNDAELSLIAIKQKSRQLPKEGVDWPRPDFATVAKGFGLRGFSATSVAEYRAALAEALAGDTPSLIDVRVDASGYLAQSVALRG
jgi:acetolactate synthase-1/2/3 large subunit